MSLSQLPAAPLHYAFLRLSRASFASLRKQCMSAAHPPRLRHSIPPGPRGNRMIHPVILSGGSGTRLWPMSRTLYPKQLLTLLGRDSLLQQTVRRVADAERFAAPLLVANEEHRFIIAEQLREIAVVPRALLLEPVGRNTAPAACIAALTLTEAEPDPLMLIMPSDHYVVELYVFACAIERVLYADGVGVLDSFGI